MSTGPAPSPPATAVFEVGAPGPGGETNPPAPEGCPLCGAPLDPEQEWCLSCGAAARTRLAMSSNWKGPIIVVAVLAAVSIAVIAISLVELAGGTSNKNIAVTITSTAAATTPAPTTAPATTAPAATAPTTTAAAGPVGLAPVTLIASSAATLNGTVNPQGVSTTYQFRFRPSASQAWKVSGAPVALGAGTSAINVNARIAFLTPGTTYHYELTASKAGHVFTTPDATFTTTHAPSKAPTTPAHTSPATTPKTKKPAYNPKKAQEEIELHRRKLEEGK
jgi:hypothetical protein